MQIHESAEDYLERILMLEQRGGQVRQIDIATELGFTKPSISVAMKKLEENGYITRDDSGAIILLPAGREIAERTYAKHTLLTDVLCAMGVPAQEAAEEACHIEHVISDETYALIRGYYEKNMKD